MLRQQDISRRLPLSYADFEELPGANTQGDTLEEARENLRDAVREVLIARRMLLGEDHRPHKVIREKISVAV